MSGRTARAARVAAEGFTVAACQASEGCGGADESVLEPLRAAARQSNFGMLISTACLGRHLYCPHHEGNSVPRAGVRVVVQPCSRDRTPLGPALTFGPLTAAAHAEALAAWLADGLPQGRRPPRHLLAVHPSAHQPRRP
ncbi:hypothetical protein [Streptomyces himalayensis]|uniref:Uncharacterized protein n=1 Tax=Streptomyces himalayensis subsp. himalayensis TaxID=2756131 RepID=A0A7W0DV41_9ACTN|nr:hypothetical protein [Streptomyces himalayensis]MBA2951863.1 hypothetical protein [Streptomyces himalayensis subsp. himalayensis]